MSSSDDQIIQSVDSIISAVETLVGDIRVAPDIDETAKNFALSKVGSVVQDLDLINRALFQNEFPSQDDTSDTNEAKTAIIGDTASSLNEMLSAWAQPEQINSQTVEPTRDDKPKPRIIVSPVKQKVKQDRDVDEQAEIQQEEEDLELASNDKLTLIDGIDDEVLVLLTKHGIQSFREIADFREADMMRLSDELRDPCRVSRENWIEQAALLQGGVLTQYAQIESDESRFDRLFYIDAYTSHPVSTAFEPSEWAVTDNASSLADRLEDVEVALEEPASIEQADEFDGLEHQDALEEQPDEGFASVGFVPQVQSEESFDEGDIDYIEPHEEIEPAEALETEDFAEQPYEPGEVESHEGAEIQVSTETEDAAETPHEDVTTPDVQELTSALLAKKQALEAELAALTGRVVDQAGPGEVEREEGEVGITVSQDFVDAEDEMFAGGSAPEVEILTHAEGQNELSERSTFYQEGGFANQDAQDPREHTQSEDEPLSSDDLGDGPIWHEEVSTGKDYVPPVVDEYEENIGQPINTAAHYNRDEEQPDGRHSHADDFSPEEGAEAFPYTPEQAYAQGEGFAGDEELADRPTSSYQQDMNGEEETSYVYDVTHLADHDPSAHQAHLTGLERSIHLSEQPQSVYQEIPPGERQASGEFHDQVDHMDGISLPRDGAGQMGGEIPAPPLEQAHFEQAQSFETAQPMMEPPLPPRGPQDVSQPLLGPQEMVSDKVPDVKEKINNGLTLGQYLASKGRNDAESLPEDDANALYPPQQREGQVHELARQDQSIRLQHSQPPMPNVNLAEAGRPPIAPPHSNLPPVPPAANGLQPTPPMPAPPMNRGDVRGVPPLPPSVQRAQNMPLERGQASQYAPNHMPQQRPDGQMIDGPTPPPFTDMPEGISEGQAYADTQRIIAAKRKADAEKARNRSEIADGQAYADTQKLMENGIPLDLQQGGERLPQPNAIPPLPPEALRAAQAYPRGKHNPDIQYRGQKPQAHTEPGMPPLPGDANFIQGDALERGEERGGKSSSGFRAKAKQFAASLQRSFGEKE